MNDGGAGMRGSRERRVRRPKDKEDLLTVLTQDARIFATYREALCFAATLGYSRGRRIPFEQSSEPIAWQVFSAPGYEAVVNMMAAVATDDFNIVAPDRFEDRLNIFEEYANGGLAVIQEQMSAGTHSPLQALLDLVIEAGAASPSPQEDIDPFLRDLL